jgi:hypothetical protein
MSENKKEGRKENAKNNKMKDIWEQVRIPIRLRKKKF